SADNIYAAPVVSNPFEGDSTALVGFLMTINIALDGGSFTVPGNAGSGSYNGTIDYGDGSLTKHFSAWDDPDFTHIYATAGNYQIKITGTFPQIYFNNVGDKLLVLSVENWGDVGWINFYRSFLGCSNLTEITAEDGVNFGAVIDFQDCFFGCSSLININTDGWDVANATKFIGMFSGCTNLTAFDGSTWTTTSLESISSMFGTCDNILTINMDNWNVSNVVSFVKVFDRCSVLTTLDIANWST
ncbi:unnamed protein product, partial [marine sediment metagenome]